MKGKCAPPPQGKVDDLGALLANALESHAALHKKKNAGNGGKRKAKGKKGKCCPRVRLQGQLTCVAEWAATKSNGLGFLR